MSFCFCDAVAAIKQIAAELRGIRFLLYRPGQLAVSLLRQGDDEMLIFKISLPPVGASDVVERRLTVTVGGGDPIVATMDPTVDTTGELAGNDNDAVHAELIDVDDSGNQSQPSTLDAVLTDTIPPPQPGAMGITMIREE